MRTLFNALHVLAAALVVGPVVLMPFLGRRAIRRREVATLRIATGLLALFAAGSVLVAGLGVATVLAADEWTLTTPWLLIAATLYLVALVVIAAYALPALRKARRLIEHEEPPTPPEPEIGEAPPPPEAVAAHGRANGRLDAIAARLAGASWLLLALFVAVVLLMTTRPT